MASQLQKISLSEGKTFRNPEQFVQHLTHLIKQNNKQNGQKSSVADFWTLDVLQEYAFESCLS
jgi:hypothetical protein